MAQGFSTVRDWLSSYQNGEYLEPANLIYLANTMVSDAPAIEANNFDVHIDSQIVQLPQAYRRRYNEGIPSTKSVRNKIVVPIAMFESHLTIDKTWLKRQPDPKAYLKTEADTHLQGLAINVGENLIYGNGDVDDSIGIANIINDKTKDFVARQIIDAGGTEGQGLTSIWLIAWSPMGATLVFPRGSTAGFYREDFASDKTTFSDETTMMSFSALFQMSLAPMIKNTRNVVRIANIPTTTLDTDTMPVSKLLDWLEEAYVKTNTGVFGKKIIYVNEKIYTKIMKAIRQDVRVIQSLSKNAIGEDFQELRFLGIPIRKNEQITNAEAQVA